ncbi:MAG: hypothetical protein ACLUL2_23100 [Blautia sp.]
MVGMFDNPGGLGKGHSHGRISYGQMTAGGWMYHRPARASLTQEQH